MKAIVAMDANRVIGNKGQIPWHIPDDLKWFKQMTTAPSGGYLIMGNTTYKKVGLLPNRFTYVLTSDVEKMRLPTTKICKYIGVSDLPNIKDILQNLGIWDRTWVVGGAKTYLTLLTQITDFYVTHIIDEYEGDVYMPEFESDFPNSEIVQEFKDRWIVKYSK